MECPICHLLVVKKEDGINATLKGHLLWDHSQKDIVEAYLQLLGEN